ncbi:MAG: type II secretion system F family protein [Actinomycetota bacterium]|nr:type II secretion system F family protein [Actinomycetota bacterium]
MSALEDRADAIRVLSGLTRIGMGLSEALSVWHERAPVALRPGLVRLGRRMRLGEDATSALRSIEPIFEEDAVALATIANVSSRQGGDVAGMLEVIARTIDARRAAVGAVRAAGAVAKASSRVVAALPIAFLPLTPGSGTSVLEPPGLVFVGLGLVLALAGVRWIRKLSPVPDPRDDSVAFVASLIAGVLKGGARPSSALDAVGRRPPEGLSGDLQTCRRLVGLGLTWTAALRRSEHSGLNALGMTLDRAQTMGLPVADALESFALLRRTERRRQFEAETRRASVLMMIPLAVCILPAFVLIAFGPFLAGLGAE